MSLTAKDYKAIDWYAKSKDLKPQLSAPPIMYFTDVNGDEVHENLESIKLQYHAWNEDDKKVCARQRKQEKQNVRI